jgi:hypothetical protein
MRHPQQRPAIAVDEVDLDQARPRRPLLVALPAEAVGEAMNRDDLVESAARSAAPANALHEVDSARMRLRSRFRAHPVQDLLRIGEEGENGGGRGGNLGLRRTMSD